MRLIDADALSTKVIFVCEDGYDGADMVLKKDIDNAPTIEAEPVKRGRWEKTEDDFYMLTILKCSVCREELVFEDMFDVDGLNYHYCPNCGAKMDGGDNV